MRWRLMLAFLTGACSAACFVMAGMFVYSAPNACIVSGSCGCLAGLFCMCASQADGRKLHP